jgi:hypothetical protein
VSRFADAPPCKIQAVYIVMCDVSHRERHVQFIEAHNACLRADGFNI